MTVVANATTRGGPTDKYALASAWVLGIGFVLASAVFIPSRERAFDTFAVPKELLMHVVAVAAAVLTTRAGKVELDRHERLLCLAIAGSALSAFVVARNGWWAHRAIALSCSGVIIWWSARQATRAGHAPLLLAGAGAGLVAVAAITLAEAYGLLPRISMTGRMPGGPGGNRNFTAHLMVLGLPVLGWLALRGPTRGRRIVWMGGLAASSSVVIVSLSRGAWLGLLALGLTGTLCWLVSGAALKRLRGPLLALAVGLMVPVVVPPSATWRNGAPYSSTLGRLLEHEAGTGRGRLIQYANTWRMIIDHPLFGVGPGNWSPSYVGYASPMDPSFNPRSVRPVPRLPNSDWFGLLAERGLLVTLLLVVVGGQLMRLAAGGLRNGSGGSKLDAGTLILCGTPALVLGAVDAVLLRPEPLFLVSLTTGALLGSLFPSVSTQPSSAWRPARLILIAAFASSALAAALSVAQVRSLRLRDSSDLNVAVAAAKLDPGEYSLHAILAHRAARAGDCTVARLHAGHARRLFPEPGGLLFVDQRCGDTHR